MQDPLTLGLDTGSKCIGSWCCPKKLDPEAIFKSIESRNKIQLALDLDVGSKRLDPDKWPIVLGQAWLQYPRDLGLRSSHTQTSWMRRPFSGPSFLGLEGDAWPKLIIIIIIIIIIVTIVINFTLQINFIFFLVIIFIINLIILMNIIIFIILDSPDQSSYNIYNTNNIIFNINTINYNKNSTWGSAV